MDYMQSLPYSYGGTVGTYQIDSPYNTACEYQVQGIAFRTAGSASLDHTQNPNVAENQLTNNASDGLGGGQIGWRFESGTQQTYSVGDAWVSCDNSLRFVCSSTCYITLVWRRAKKQQTFAPMIQVPAEHEEQGMITHARAMGVR